MLYNIKFDIAAIIVSIFSVFLALNKKVTKKRQNIILYFMLVLCFFTAIFDILRAIGNSNITDWTYETKAAFYYTYLLLQNTMPCMFCIYILSLLEIKKKIKKNRILCNIVLIMPFLSDIVLFVINPYFKEIFYYDENGTYIRGWGMTIVYVNVFIYLVVNYFIMKKYGKHLDFVKKASVYVFLTAGIGSVMIQMIFPNLLIQLFIEVLCLSGILFTVENENEILHSILMYFFLFAIGIIFEIHIIPDVLPLRLMTEIYYMLLLLAFLLYFAERLVDRGKLRVYLISCVWLMIGFIILRLLKNEVFTGESIIGRYIWYGYSIPLLLTALLTYYASLCIGENNNKSYKMKNVSYAVISVLLFFLVITNDYHQLAFRFNSGFENWSDDYSYAIVFYLVMAWAYLMYFSALVMMARQSRLSSARRFWWLTFIPFIIGIIMLIMVATGNMLTINGVIIFQFPEITCFMVALFWECCIQLGLLPSNKGYSELMGISSIALQITDNNKKTIYKSSTATDLTFMQKSNKDAVSINGDTVLYREKISGGYSYWQDDISELNRVNRELEEIQSRLSEETELIRLENELKERQYSINQRTQIYDLIAAKTKPQADKISSYAELAISSGDSGEKRKYANIICVLGAYIKRYSNLTLLAENYGKMNSLELGMAIAESLRYLGNAGIPADYMGDVTGKLSSDVVLVIYENFEKLIELYIDELDAVYVRMSEDKGIIIKITFEGAEVFFSKSMKEKYEEYGIEADIEYEDDISYMRLYYNEGGAM